MTDGDVSLRGSSARGQLSGAQPTAPGWLIVALSWHIYLAYLATIKPRVQQKQCRPAFKGKATKQRVPRGDGVPYIFAL